jgi:hypothetical protein
VDQAAEPVPAQNAYAGHVGRRMRLPGGWVLLPGLVRPMHGVARFTGAFGAVLTAIGVQIVKTPGQAPRANAIAGRWIGSARRECLDRILITGERHLRLVLREYADHYNTHRPHRALNQNPPAGRTDSPAGSACVRVLRRDRLGGLIHEHAQAA